MSDRIRQIVSQISALEVELQAALVAQECRIEHPTGDATAASGHAGKQARRKTGMSFLYWFFTVRPQNFLTIPFIYGMVVPLALLDLCISLYQLVCFPIYGVAKVKRGDYFVLDRHRLPYLNFIEKIDCMYCGYAVGSLGYASEIIARTEQYFCPIKHARKILGAHVRYAQFLGYGEADNFHEKLEEFRSELAREAQQEGKQNDADEAPR